MIDRLALGLGLGWIGGSIMTNLLWYWTNTVKEKREEERRKRSRS